MGLRSLLDRAALPLGLIAFSLVGTWLNWRATHPPRRSHPHPGPPRSPTPRPAARTSTPLPVDESWTPEQCAEVFETLKVGEEVHFFAADVPSPSDPGGYVTASRGPEGHLTRWVGNHGWHLDSEEVSLDTLRDELHRNRAVQTLLVNGTPVSQAYRLEARENP